MKTQVEKKLNFKKNVITELNENALINIKGGSDSGLEGDGIPPVSRYTSWLCNGVK